MTCPMSPELGAFVLHALEEPIEREVQNHLAECDECLHEVGELASTAVLLALVPPEEAETLDDRASRRTARRPRRRLLGAAAAAVALTAGLGVPLLEDHHQPPRPVVLHGVGQQSGARAAVSMTPDGSGTQVRLALSGVPEHGWCSLVAHGVDGEREITATWPANGYGRVDVSATSDIPVSRLSELSVVTDTGRRLVTIPVPHPSS